MRASSISRPEGVFIFQPIKFFSCVKKQKRWTELENCRHLLFFYTATATTVCHGTTDIRSGICCILQAHMSKLFAQPVKKENKSHTHNISI